MRTYKVRAIVLRKTKLGEKDVIATMLSESGSLIRAVGKGARKPGGSLAGRIELFSEIDAMLANGRNLDVITEARLAAGGDMRSFGLEQSACASAIAELLCNVAQEDLEHPRLYDMTRVALGVIAVSEPTQALVITGACLLKVLASAGFRPSLDACVSCGNKIDVGDMGQWVSVSFADGGLVCQDCERPADSIPVEATTIAWAQVFLYTRFSDLLEMEIGPNVSFSVLQFARQWARVHAGRDIKSLDFLFTSGLF